MQNTRSIQAGFSLVELVIVLLVGAILLGTTLAIFSIQRELGQYKEADREMDKILDKISKHGIGSLSRQEKKILKQASQKRQDGKKY